MRLLTIRTRLFILAGVLLTVVIGSNLYLIRNVADNAAALTRSTQLLADIELANNTRLTFGEMRYWLADLAVTQLMQSQRNEPCAPACRP